MSSIRPTRSIYVTYRERKFLIWNDAAERISGYRRNEVIGRSCCDDILYHTDAQGNRLCHCDCPLLRTLNTGTLSGPVVVYLRHKQGRNVPVEVSTSPLFDDEGAIMGAVELFEDVSLRLERERLLVERNHELEAVMNNIREGVRGHGVHAGKSKRLLLFHWLKQSEKAS